MSTEQLTLKQKVRVGIGALAVVLVLILFFQNQETVSTRVLFWSMEMPRFVLLASVFLLGSLAGFLFGRRR